MKMIIAIIDDALSDDISKALLKSNFRATRLASTKGLLRSGRSTFMIGVDDNDVQKALENIRSTVPPSEDPKKVQATIYVLNIRDFERV